MSLLKSISGFGIFTMITAMSWSTGLDSAMDDLNADDSNSTVRNFQQALGATMDLELGMEDLIEDPGPTPPPPIEEPPPVEEPPPGEHMASIYGCLVESYQNYGVRDWYIGRIRQKTWKGGPVSSNRSAIRHSVNINYNDRALKTFRIFNTCQTTLATMSKDIYEDVIDSIRIDLDEHAAGLTEEVDRVIEEWETRGHHDDIRKTNSPPKVIFNTRNLQADPTTQFNLIRSFADKSNIRRRNPNALSQLKKKSADTLRNGTAWVVALRILISHPLKERRFYVSDPISDQTYREVTDSQNARDEAAEAQKTQSERIKENIAKAFKQRRYDDVIQQIDAFKQLMRYDAPNFLRRDDQFSDKEKQDMLDRVAPKISDIEAKFGEGLLLYAHKAYQRKDYTYSVIFLEKAIEYGNDDARVALANIYRDGKHVRKDISKSNRLLLEAAKNGNAAAKAKLLKIGPKNKLRKL